MRQHKFKKQTRSISVCLNLILPWEFCICPRGISLQPDVMALFSNKLEINYKGSADKTLTRCGELVQSTPQSSHLEWYAMCDNSVSPLRVLSSKDRSVVCTRISSRGLSGRSSQCHVCPTPVYLTPLFPTVYTAAFTFHYLFCCVVLFLFRGVSFRCLTWYHKYIVFPLPYTFSFCFQHI